MTDIDIVTRLRIPWEGMGDMGNQQRAEAADEIERLRAERDEARQEVCIWVATRLHSSAIKEARVREWDCFSQGKTIR
jgi:hypothetical protein